MGPGPSNMDPRVLSALSRPVVGHLDPGFVAFMDDLKELLRYAFQTKNAMTLPISAPGSAGMELCFVNLVEAGDQVVVCRNGVFGGRMLENVKRTRGLPIIIDDDWGRPVDPNQLEDALKANPDAKLVASVHAETSTGARSDVQTLAGIAHEHDCLIIVDTVTSLGGIPLEVDAWGLDAVYSGSQKCLSCTPGLSPVTFSERALAKVRARREAVQSWFLDLNLLNAYWDDGQNQRSYHHTAPVHTLMALHESLAILAAEGLEAAHARHRAAHEQLRDGLAPLGIEYLVDAEWRLPQLNSVIVPAALQEREAAIRRALLDEDGIEIGAGLGDLAGKIWRIGTMGYTARSENITRLLSALAGRL
ncbi:MAG: alanine--glyoxylate aminotransferase family protein [bacterium]|nr:alanine--glyoxylate aminotransferase family protein [bacterium]